MQTMLFSIIAAGLLIGMARGGKLSNILLLSRIRYPWLAFLSVMCEFSLILMLEKGIIQSQAMVLTVLIIQYALLFLFLWFNRNLPFSYLIALGSFLNFFVIALNFGSMPLSSTALSLRLSPQKLKLLEEGRLLTYHIVNNETRLWFLGDVIFLSKPFMTLISVGDIILFLGILLLLQSVIANKSDSIP